MTKAWQQIRHDLQRVILRYTNILFTLVIVGFVMQYTNQSAALIFSFNLVAVFPSSVLLGIGLKSIGSRYGSFIQAILYMTFGNAVQLITSVMLLKQRQIKVLQTSLIGGILSNMHLMLGLGFLLGGINRMEQNYNIAVSGLYGSLLLLSVTGLILPTASDKLAKPLPSGVVRQSRAISIVFLVVYFCLLLFQLRTHAELLTEPSQKAPKRGNKKSKNVGQGILTSAGGVGAAAAGSVSMIHGATDIEGEEDDGSYANQHNQLATVTSIFVIAITTTLIGFNTYFATNSLEGLLGSTRLTSSFVGIVLLPLFTNDLEPITAAAEDTMDMCVQATVGKCIQAVLFVIPVIILLGWAMGIDEMTLSFDGFEVAALFASALYIGSLISNGKSLWFEGVALLAMFIIISISAFYIE